LLTAKSDEAARESRVAVALGPDSALAHHYLGMALFELRRFDEAAEEFREVLRLAPGAENHYDLAACLMTMGLYDQALAEL
jgi:tetratricopeptide (TPR) repeat protein